MCVYLSYIGYMYLRETGSARWDDKKEGGWKDRMDDWKMQQGNLGPEPEDDLEAAMYVSKFLAHGIVGNAQTILAMFCNNKLTFKLNSWLTLDNM